MSARPAPLLTRTAATWLLYALLGCLGFLINGLGAINPCAASWA